MIVDREKRDFLAEKFRQLLSGRIGNLEYDDLELDGHFDSDDPAVHAVFMQSWFLYDDFKAHPIDLSRDDRRELSRCVLFLHSSLPYEWPKSSGIRLLLGIVGNILTLGLLSDKIAAMTQGRLPEDAEREYWPFYREQVFNKANENPRLFNRPGEQDVRLDAE